MKRLAFTPREQWQDKLNAIGFTFHSLPSENNEPYWRESVAYEVTIDEVEQFEKDTKELFDRCMDAIDFIIANKRYAEFGIPEAFWPLIEESWDKDYATVYGRFDLAWQPDGKPAKMLEFNADTPTSLIESSVAQWFWMKDTFGEDKDQFNMIHEYLIDQWKHIRINRWKLPQDAPLYVASLRDNGDDELLSEDYDTVAYMAETAKLAGFKPQHIFMEDIGWSDDYQSFVDATGKPIRHIFKLYPWEWMVHEQFADNIIRSWQRTNWIEPIWKMLLSNKQLAVILWELFPDHPNLLPSYNDAAPFIGKQYVRKPKLGREGANVEIIGMDGSLIETAVGGYGDEGYIYQEYVDLPHFNDWNAVVGSWIVGETPVGIDFRETSTRITGDMAFFVPHYIS